MAPELRANCPAARSVSNAGTPFVVSDGDDYPTTLLSLLLYILYCTVLYTVSLKGRSTCEDLVTGISVQLTWTAVFFRAVP